MLRARLRSCVYATTVASVFQPWKDDAETWREYDATADLIAARRLAGDTSSPLPMLSPECQAEIEADPEAFAERVRAFCYARAMEATERRHREDGADSQQS